MADNVAVPMEFGMRVGGNVTGLIVKRCISNTLGANSDKYIITFVRKGYRARRYARPTAAIASSGACTQAGGVRAGRDGAV